jgi:signal transduction histidine kinase
LALINKYPVWLTAIFIIILMLGYALFEYSAKSLPDSEDALSPLIAESLDEAVAYFDDLSKELEQTTGDIARITEQAVETNSDKMALFNRLRQHHLWGYTIFKNGEKWLWNDYVISLPQLTQQRESGSSIRNLNNVVLLVHQTSLQVDDDLYIILAAQRLSQTTDLPFIKNADFDLAAEHLNSGYFPVHFNFIGTVPSGVEYRELQTPDGNSAGAVWATSADAHLYFNSITESQNRWRFNFQLAVFFSLFLFIIVLSNQKKFLTVNAGLVFLVIVAWPVFLNSGLLEHWISLNAAYPAELSIDTINKLSVYVAHSVFLLLLFITVHNLLRFFDKPFSSDNHFRTFSFAIVFGGIAVLLLHFFLHQTEQLLVNSSIPLMDLELAPDNSSFIFYIFSGIFFTAACGIIITAGYHLFKIEEDKSVLISLVSVFSFFLAYYLLERFTSGQMILSWPFALSFLLFLLFLLIIHYLQKFPAAFFEMSGFRKLMLTVFIASTVLYIIIWNTHHDRMDRELLDEVAEFTEEEEISTRNILFELLSDTEQDFLQFSNLPPADQIFRTLSQYQRTVQNNIRQSWGNHSYHIRLLTDTGEELASYSTTLDTPTWSTYFNTNVMLGAYRGEQIRWQTNRPVIWGRPANISERYTAFERGWIPVYNHFDGTEIVLWIAGDVYSERPDYNRPLRAVLSAATAADWKRSYYMAEFRENRLARSTIKGIYRNQPQYTKLPEREAEIALQNPVTFFTNITSEGSFREVLVNRNDQSIIKGSSPLPGLYHHLFSYFRLQIVLVFFGLFCFSILAILGQNHFSLFGQNRRFRDRLIDGLSLATILFLAVLIFSTQYAVSIQNERSVERDLMQALSGISESLKQSNIFLVNDDASDILTDITTTANADLILYRGSDVHQSTTPQIFQQHLLPSTLSYPAYDFLFNRERTHFLTTAEIGDEEMVIGYRSVHDAQGNIAGVVAIPTFLHSPVYNENLLETTSYLFVVYLFIFALFIGGTVFLSSQLTKPLKIIQSGLNQISRGDMKTKVAVTSRDEIGSLANAYNTMVQRLDHAQKELMKAERESAWQEMAQQVAHEIKNPLTPMKLNLQHLQRQLESNPGKALELKPMIEKTASNIIEQIESLNKIASDFSKFAKPVREPLKETELTSVVKSVSELYEHDSSATIKLKIPVEEIQILAVEDELRRAFINLVKNAIEAAKNGHAVININLKLLKEHVMIQIKDNGVGIDENDRDKIFLPRFSTKSSGTGLGLAITKKIIEAHNGDIWFESKKDQGSSFFIRLPLN